MDTSCCLKLRLRSCSLMLLSIHSASGLPNVLAFLSIWTASIIYALPCRKSHLNEHSGRNGNLKIGFLSQLKSQMNSNTHAPHEAYSALGKKDQVLHSCQNSNIHYYLMERQQTESEWEQEGARRGEKKEKKKEHEYVIERHFMNTSGSDLCKAKQMKGGQRKIEVYMVSCHGGQLKAHNCAGAHTHPVNPSVSVLSSPTIHPFTHLYLCFSDGDKGKHSITDPPFPPSLLSLGLFRQGLGGLISNCDQTTWWKDWHTHANTHSVHTHKNVYESTQMWQRGGQGPVLLDLIIPQARHNEGAGKKQGILPFLMSAIACRTYAHMHAQLCVCLEAKRLGCFLVPVTIIFISFSQHINMIKPRKRQEKQGEEKVKKMKSGGDVKSST